MALTLVNWINVIAIFIVLGLGSFAFGAQIADNELAGGLVGVIVAIVITLGLMFGLNWYNTSTASGIRAYKDFKSELSNGIDREITITAEDGREIFHYEGKVDVESNHEDNYIKFESEDGKRYIIYYGIQDTITIIEK